MRKHFNALYGWFYRALLFKKDNLNKDNLGKQR